MVTKFYEIKGFLFFEFSFFLNYFFTLQKIVFHNFLIKKAYHKFKATRGS